MKLTDEQIKIIARHAAEGAEQQARQQNERVELMERQAAELATAGIQRTPPPRPAHLSPPPAPPAPPPSEPPADDDEQPHRKGKKHRG